jgi:hypothetical protein
MPIIGLMPAPPSSVDPRGIAPPFSVVPTPVPGVDSGEAMPLVESPCDGVAQDVEVAEAVDPPPSNVELVVVEDPVAPAPMVLEPMVLEPMVLEPMVPPLIGEDGSVAKQFALGAGLKPPGSIPVAPRGMPVPVDVDAPGTPSGEVPGSGGMVVIGLCA